MEFFRRLRQRLAEDRELVDEDRDLAGLGTAQRAVDADEVAEVELLHQLPLGVGQVAAREQELNAAGRILDVEEPQLARLAAEHDAAGDADAVAADATGLRAQRAGFADRSQPVESLAERVVAEFLDLGELFEPRGLEAVWLVWM